MSFFTNEENTIKIRVCHESLELMGEAETYEEFSELCERRVSSVALVDFSELNHISDNELTNISRFISVLKLLDLEVRKINISPMLSRSIASRPINEFNKALWRR